MDAGGHTGEEEIEKLVDLLDEFSIIRCGFRRGLRLLHHAEPHAMEDMEEKRRCPFDVHKTQFAVPRSIPEDAREKPEFIVLHGTEKRAELRMENAPVIVLELCEVQEFAEELEPPSGEAPELCAGGSVKEKDRVERGNEVPLFPFEDRAQDVILRRMSKRRDHDDIAFTITFFFEDPFINEIHI